MTPGAAFLRRAMLAGAALALAATAGSAMGAAERKDAVMGCAGAGEGPVVLAESADGAIAFDRLVTRTPLHATCGKDALAARVAGAGPDRRFLIRIDDIRIRTQPGVLFDLSLAAPAAHGRLRGGTVFGRLNFFASKPEGQPGQPRSISYDVTRRLAKLAHEQRLSNGLVLVATALQPPHEGAGATAARIRLIEP